MNKEQIARRDFFAAASLIGLLAQENLEDGEAGTPESVASGAYAFADAMVKKSGDGDKIKNTEGCEKNEMVFLGAGKPYVPNTSGEPYSNLELKGTRVLTKLILDPAHTYEVYLKKI